MKDIAIYGANGFGREVACLLNSINNKEPKWNLIGFFDDTIDKGYRTDYGSVIGGINELNNFDKPISIVFADCSPKIVYSLVSAISNSFVEYPNIFAPDLIYLDKESVFLGRGNVFFQGCNISCNVTIGDFNIFKGSIGVGHDSKIGNFNSIMPAVRISGNVKIGDKNLLGISSILLQNITIGNETIVGANSLIIHKTKDRKTYFGNPAKIIDFLELTFFYLTLT